MIEPNAHSNTPRWLPLLLVAAVLVLFWPTLLHPLYILHPTFSPFSDTMVIHWPKARLMAQSWQAGTGLPYWTPLILSGMPLAANQLAMLFYPPAWLFLFLPNELVFNLLHFFHLLLGGSGIYLLLREKHNLSPIAALLGGLTYALNGKWLAHMTGGHVSMVGAIGWMPWVLFGLLMLLESTAKTRLPRFKWSLLVAIALAMQIVTHTLIFIYSVYLAIAVVGWQILLLLRKGKSQGQDWPDAIGDAITEIKYLFLPLAFIPIVAVLLGAAQLLPLIELVDFSNRSLNLAQAQQYSVTLTQLIIGLLLPSAQGGHELVIYLGLIPLLLIPIGLTRRDPWTWFYGGLLIFTILFALGPSTPVHSFFYHLIPGFKWVRTPARMFFVGAMAASVLVGFAIQQLIEVRWSFKAQHRVTLIAVAVGALALMLGAGLALAFGQLGRASLVLAIFIPLGLGVIMLRIRRIIPAQLTVILLGILLFLDLASFDVSMMKFIPLDEAVAPGRPAAEYLAQKPGLFRTYSPSYSLPMQTAAAYNLQLADGVEPVHLAVYDEFMARAGGYNNSGFSVTIPNFGDGPLDEALKDTRPDLKLLGLLNVEYLASAFPMNWPGLTPDTEIEGTYIYTNQHAQPRARIVHQTLSAEADWLTQLQSMPNLANVVIIENGPHLDSIRPASTADVTRYTAASLSIETEIEEPGWLVLSEVWYPGWQAAVNGVPHDVERVNGLLRGVYLEESGQYEITMTYRPKSIVWGNWIAGITACLVIFTAGWKSLHSIF